MLALPARVTCSTCQGVQVKVRAGLQRLRTCPTTMLRPHQQRRAHRLGRRCTGVENDVVRAIQLTVATCGAAQQTIRCHEETLATLQSLHFACDRSAEVAPTVEVRKLGWVHRDPELIRLRLGQEARSGLAQGEHDVRTRPCVPADRSSWERGTCSKHAMLLGARSCARKVWVGVEARCRTTRSMRCTRIVVLGGKDSEVSGRLVVAGLQVWACSKLVRLPHQDSRRQSVQTAHCHVVRTDSTPSSEWGR